MAAQSRPTSTYSLTRTNYPGPGHISTSVALGVHKQEANPYDSTLSRLVFAYRWEQLRKFTMVTMDTIPRLGGSQQTFVT